ncbi:type II toxin-antitoxin system prevent-host-death family antitoxin, partial [Streptomyces sp. NPDC059477]|uniref:type II toxin-antitoxin system prevent-host-death family antitoxin n=1 Tax=Streptomyces sp. NPDC059477 TaxID=3346847 RepID=UPI00369CDB0F
MPLALRQDLSGHAHRLVNPPRGGLAEKSGRPLRLALSAAAKLRPTGAHWHVLLTTPRSAFGGPTSDRAEQAYGVLQQVVDEYLRPVLAAASTATAEPDAPATASSAAIPNTTTARPAPALAPVSGTPVSSAAEKPAPPAPSEIVTDDSDHQPATTSTPTMPTPALPAPAAPATLHQARAKLPELIRAATNGAPTPLTARDTDHALLTTPHAATALGWDLTHAPVHGIADARKKLGDLIHEAAHGHPQILRRHTTPVAVLLPATPDQAPRPPIAAPPPTPAPELAGSTTPAATGTASLSIAAPA